MQEEVEAIQNRLRQIMMTHMGPLMISKESDANLEITGTIKAQQGKQMVDGHYFCSIMSKPKDVRFYFFPIYTHVGEFSLSPELDKMLKGKSCFHIKYLTDGLESEIKGMVKKGIEVYQKHGLIASTN